MSKSLVSEMLKQIRNDIRIDLKRVRGDYYEEGCIDGELYLERLSRLQEMLDAIED
jgi:hypothetical protein